MKRARKKPEVPLLLRLAAGLMQQEPGGEVFLTEDGARAILGDEGFEAWQRQERGGG